MSLKSKLSILFLSTAFIPSLLIGILTFINYKNSLEADIVSKMHDIAIFKSDKIETYFFSLKKDIELTQGFWIVRNNLPAVIRFARDTAHPEFVIAKQNLDGYLQPKQKIFGLANIMLADLKGEVVYSSEPRYYQKHFLNPVPDPQQKSFKEGLGGIYFSDIFIDEAEDDTPKMMVSAPMLDPQSKLIGVVLFEVDMNPFYDLVQDVTGLGVTGETLLGKKIGNQIIFLNRLRHDPQAALKRKVTLGDSTAIPIQNAVQHKTGAGHSIDYRKKPVIAGWTYIPSLDWGLVAKIDTREAFADVINLRNLLVIILIIVFVVSDITANFIAKAISDAHDKLNREISVRKKAEEELQDSEAWLFTTMNSIGDGLIATDKNGLVVFINPVAESLTGWIQEESKGLSLKTIFNIINEQTGQKVEDPASKVIREGTIVRLVNHTILIAKDGARVAIDDSAAPIKDPDGNFIGVVLIFRDATKKRAAEKNLQESLKLKTDFTNLVSHELRTPLSALKESVSLVTETLSGQENAKQKELLGIAKNNIDRLTRLINNILDFQKFEAGKMEFERRESDINDVVREARKMMVSLAESKGLDIKLDLGDNLSKILFDRDKIIQVLINLLNNSLKVTKIGGIIISTAKEQNVIKVSVKDTGPGVKEEDIPKLFKQYGQLERASGSTGLGLAISKEIIRLHGGKIWAESKLGGGLTVHFILPIIERRGKG